MKYQGKDVYKNTDIGDVLATNNEANEAISHGHFVEIGRGKDSYFVIDTPNKGDTMKKTVCKSGIIGWKSRLQENYSSFSEFISFDYSKSIYKNSETPLEIICKKCGKSFYQKPYKHLRGYG